MKTLNRIAALLAAAALTISFCSCGKRSENKNMGGTVAATSEAATDSVCEKEQTTASEVLDKLSESGLCPELDERADYGSDVFTNACDKLYSEPAESFSDGGIMFVSSGAAADEISVLKSDSADCQKLLEDRKQRRYKDFEGYAPAELDKIDKARIFEAGGLWILIISDKAEDAEKLICG